MPTYVVILAVVSLLPSGTGPFAPTHSLLSTRPLAHTAVDDHMANRLFGKVIRRPDPGFRQEGEVVLRLPDHAPTPQRPLGMYGKE